MAYLYTDTYSYNYLPSYSSTFLPCCNAPVAVDGLYQSKHVQEIYYAPEPPPQIEVVRQRLPDPPPDVIERVVVVPQPKKYVYQVVEVPSKPPPVVQQRVVQQAPNPNFMWWYLSCSSTSKIKYSINRISTSFSKHSSIIIFYSTTTRWYSSTTI